MSDCEVPRHDLLVVAPHHDDESIGCGGLLARQADRGWICGVVFVFAPLDEAGAAVSHEANRYAEAREAARILRISTIESIGLPGRTRVDAADLSWQLVGVMRRMRPTVLLVPHSKERDPEHRVVHRAALEASWLSRTRLRGDLGTPMSAIGVILGYEVWTPIGRPQFTVDIAPYLETKVAAIRAYESQCETRDYAVAAAGLARYRGVMHGRSEAAEAYQVVRDDNADIVAPL